MIKKILFTFFVANLLLVNNILADKKTSHNCGEKEKKGVVKVELLDNFSDTMHEMWHDGWVNKDFELIKKLYPKASEFVANLEKSDVPKGLEERKDKWARGVKALSSSLEKIKAAIDQNNEKQILDEVEKFHQVYEFMVSLTKPYVKEVEEFHKSMAKLYHRNYPDFNLDEMKNDIKQMYVVLNSLDKVKLPDYYKDKTKEFKKVVKELRESVKDLDKYIQTTKNLNKDDKMLKDKVEKLHTDFHTLADLFD